MHPETHLALHHVRTAELRAEADAYGLVAAARKPRHLRTRLGWALVGVGLRLATNPRTAVALP
ncbi:hypothetical protein EV562_101110 [Streptomyces sp. BK208]|uniref:hypothetical protein n=1 Tax=Streptomyces sp. BK208 TaxID=2512150 RepID=UPI001060DE0C|nr:hypothetical protein [Streptomyces sp. BK208]TDT42141.1 hypothetical protein EV562_101110 [Streptomyces sp. BK208]